MAAADLFERLLIGGAMALLMIGAVAALMSSNAMKRLVGVSIATLGALAALAALGAPDGALVAGAALLLGQTVIGVAIVVRLQEGYGGVETPDIDTADASDEPRDAAQ
jgi:hypothetical protein